MMSNSGFGLVLFFGLLVRSFGLPENINISGNASNYSTAIDICKKNAQQLISLEGDKMTDVIHFMKEKGIHSVWLNAEYETLKNWTFTDPRGTILEDEYIDISHGGSCGAYGTRENRFKSYPCNQSFEPLKIEGSGVTFYYNLGSVEKRQQSWFSLNKSILATPPSNSTYHLKKFEDFEQDVSNVFNSRFPVTLREYYWIGLNKFEFIWPDGTKVALNKLSWEDGSPNEQCLILSNDGNESSLKVVNCEGEKTHQVMCIPETDGGYPKWQWIAFYALLGASVVLSVVVIAICVVEKKKKRPVYPIRNCQHVNGAIRENSFYAKAGGPHTSVKRPLPERPVQNHVIIPQIGEDTVNYEEVDLSP